MSNWGSMPMIKPKKGKGTFCNLLFLGFINIRKVMIRKYFLLATLFLSCNLSSQKLEITSKYLHSKDVENVKLFHKNNEFIVQEENGDKVTVQRCFIDKEVRGISSSQLSFMLGMNKHIEIDDKPYIFYIKELTSDNQEEIKKLNNIQRLDFSTLSDEDSAAALELFSPFSRLSLSKNSEDEYIIHFGSLLKGGGAGGAVVGCWLGKLVVYTVGHGFIVVSSVAVGVATANPGATALAFVQMEAALGAEIEAASQVCAMAGGILGGVATGPV